MRIGILGSGDVGQALARGYRRHGHEVRIGTRKQAVDDLPVGAPYDVAEQAELVVLAVLGSAAVDVVTGVAPALAGKVLVDATNPRTFNSARRGCSSGVTTRSASGCSAPCPTRASSRRTTRSATR